MAVVRRVGLKDFAREVKGYTSASLAEQKRAVIDGVFAALPHLAEISPVDTGRYAASWDVEVHADEVILGNYAPYAGIIENGTRPFTPPIAPLLMWAKHVLQDPSQPPDYSEEVWALAKAVQQKIAREGMKPHNIMRDAIPWIMNKIAEELRKHG